MRPLAISNVIKMTSLKAKTLAQQHRTPHMTTAQIFPHVPNNQSISSRTPPSPAPRWGCMLNYSLCSVVRLSWLRLCWSVSASSPADCQILLLLLAGSEAETRTSSLCVDMTRAKNSLAVGVRGEILEWNHMVLQTILSRY